MGTVYLSDIRFNEHDLPRHPEHAGRLRAIWQQLESSNLLSRMMPLVAQPATQQQLLAAHTPRYLHHLEQISQAQHPLHYLNPDTYARPTSYTIAQLAAGAAIQAVDAVLSGQADNALAAIRPPGHHAMPDSAMGFCLLGNAAIAARFAQQEYNIRRILLVDFDVHHGNGTEAMLYDDPGVLFISTHQAPFYPGTGDLEDTGTGAGTGYTVNIPLSAGHGDETYNTIFQQIIWPLAQRYQPEMVLVSAGFDAHWRDPLAGMQLSLTGYAHITQELMRIAQTFCQGKIIFVLEGGYDLDVLAHGIQNITHALLGDDEISDPLGQMHNAKAPSSALIRRLAAVHQIAL